MAKKLDKVKTFQEFMTVTKTRDEQTIVYYLIIGYKVYMALESYIFADEKK